MPSASQPGPDRQRARNKGLDRLSAVTLGVAAASLAGAAGIGVSLYTSSALASADATTVAPQRPAGPNNGSLGTNGPGTDGPGTNGLGTDGLGPDGSNPQNANPDDSGPDDSGQNGPGPQFQPGQPPSGSDQPPGATSGGS